MPTVNQQATLKLPNIDYHATQDPRLAETLRYLADAIAQVSLQGNFNPVGPRPVPPQISAVNVSGVGGNHQVQIQDNSPAQIGVVNHAEYSLSPNFTNPVLAHTGPSRNLNIFMGKGPVYWRAFSSYLGGPPSDPVYFGSAAQPQATDAGGVINGPATAPIGSAGSGTEPSVNFRGGVGFGIEANRE